MNQYVLAALVAIIGAKLTIAENLTTISGKTYSNVIVTRAEPDGLYIKHSAGIGKIFFSELPQEVRDNYGYNPLKAAEYTRSKMEEQRIAQQNARKHDGNAATYYGVSIDGYNQIKAGMSFAEVVNILGQPEQELGRAQVGDEEVVTYDWKGYSGSGRMSVVFVNNAVTTKMQFGLMRDLNRMLAETADELDFFKNAEKNSGSSINDTNGIPDKSDGNTQDDYNNRLPDVPEAP